MGWGTADCERRRPASPAEGLIDITSQPVGAAVRLDDAAGKLLGSTPLRAVRLSRGRHTLWFSLEEYRQLSGSTARIPPLPKNYDVEKKGRYSAGTFSHPKAARKPSKKRQTAKLPVEIPEDPD